MNTRRWFCVVLAAAVAMAELQAQAPEPNLPRPGAIVATQVIGEVSVMAGDQTKPLKADERVRVGVTLTTGRRSLAVLELSNGTTLQLGSESEVELEEFGQQQVSGTIKVAELKEEPTISRVRLHLVRGELGADVKRLKAQRGSSFTVALVAGTLRMTEGTFRTHVRMTELGLGVCTLDVLAGVAEFEPLGGAFQPVPVGKRLGFAIETDRATGAIKLSELPSAEGGKAGAIVQPRTPPPAVSELQRAPEPPRSKEQPKAKK